MLPKIIAGIRLTTKSRIRFRAQAAARLTLPSPSFGERSGRGENDAIRAGYVSKAVHHGRPVGGALAGREIANLFRTTRARGERHVARPAYGLAADAESQTVARGSLYGWWFGRTRRLDPRRPRSSSRQSPNQTQRALGSLAPATAVRIWRPINQFNARARARRHVAHHYDLNGRLYSLFLDRDRQYSCAYFPKGTETLEEAQEAKKHHIAAKLCLDQPGLSVLDIGCGWGGMALTLARDYGARVTGITLSTEQLAEAQARAEAEGLADRVSFQLLDYRAADQSFDRIVSVGMFEHVGVFHYRASPALS